MEANHQHAVPEQRQKRHRQEGPRNHILSYAISVFLTLLAFMAVSDKSLGKTFVELFIVFLAFTQVVVQLAFWMHMKDRGHLLPIYGILMGAFVAATGASMAIYWLWW